MPRLTVALELELSPEDGARVSAGLIAGDPARIGARDYRGIAVSLRDPTGTLIGGLVGATMWGWLMVDALWVELAVRRCGYGTVLLGTAEEEARHRGCANARLDTFDFQARDFYERCGYKVYAELAGFPPDHVQYHMRKSLAAAGVLTNH